VTAAAAVVAALAAAAGPAGGQFGATTELVEVYATVLDARGAPVQGLTAGDFEVLENGAAQPITQFTAGEFPLSVAVVIDRSFSMGERIGDARAGARRLIDQLHARDRVLVLGIGGKVDVLAGFDASRAAARRAAETAQVWGTSPIGDVVAHGIDAVQGEPGRRAVVIWSDGVEREATVARDDVLDRVRRSGVLVYSVAMGAKPSPLLTSLASLSGGRLLEARNRRAAEDAAATVAGELRHQYLLGYSPPPGPAGWRDISVRVKNANHTVRARKGYVATAGVRPASF
jgi:Ca-activated chloride channel family protein